MQDKDALKIMIELTSEDEFIIVREGLVYGYTKKPTFDCTVSARNVNGYGKTYAEAIADWKRKRELEREDAIKRLQEMAA